MYALGKKVGTSVGYSWVDSSNEPDYQNKICNRKCDIAIIDQQVNYIVRQTIYYITILQHTNEILQFFIRTKCLMF